VNREKLMEKLLAETRTLMNLLDPDYVNPADALSNAQWESLMRVKDALKKLDKTR